MKLLRETVANVSLMCTLFGVEAASNIALVLAGMQPGYRHDHGPLWFDETGDYEAFRLLVREAWNRNYSNFVNFVYAKFRGVLEAADQCEFSKYRVGAVSASDLKAIGRKNFSRANPH